MSDSQASAGTPLSRADVHEVAEQVVSLVLSICEAFY
jgi:hypothetical protein